MHAAWAVAERAIPRAVTRVGVVLLPLLTVAALIANLTVLAKTFAVLDALAAILLIVGDRRRRALGRRQPSPFERRLPHGDGTHPGQPALAPKKPFELANPITFTDLRQVLDVSVIGQDDAKDRLSLLLAVHLTLFDASNRRRPIPNAIVLGPTGVGKTFSMQTLAESYLLPFVVVDTTSLVPSGIVGFQVEDVMKMLYDEAERLLRQGGFRHGKADIISLAERGVVFFDEFDKIATPNESETSDDSSRRLVQRRLLKLVEGDNVRVGVKHREGVLEDMFLDTSRMLVMVGGAFADLDERTAGKRLNRELYSELFGPEVISAEDIRIYGYLPELIARFPLIIPFSPLTTRDLLNILARAPDSPLVIWKRYAELSGLSLTVSADAMALLAKHAAKLQIGARGLQQLLFPYLADKFVSALKSQTPNIEITALDLQPRGELYAARTVNLLETNGDSEHEDRGAL